MNEEDAREELASMGVEEGATVNLWHDDIRKPTDDWVWARTNQQAKAVLTLCEVQMASLDHDLGLDGHDPAEYESPELMIGQGEETGLDLAEWMAETGRCPEYVRIHSYNPYGASRMAATLKETKGDREFPPLVIQRPFELGWVAVDDPDLKSALSLIEGRKTE